MEGKGWVAAGELTIGDSLRQSSGETATIRTIKTEQLDEPIKVYNFEVEDFHTYFVGETGVLVHNMCAARDAGKVNADGLPVDDKITGWTKHGTEQALGRDGGIGVSNSAISDAVNNPAQPPILQSGGTIKYIGQDATVILNQNGQVVTTWANVSTGTR